MRKLAYALAFLLCLPAAAFAQKRPMTHEDTWLMKRTGEPVVSPDGRWIVFLLTEPDYDPAKQKALVFESDDDPLSTNAKTESWARSQAANEGPYAATVSVRPPALFGSRGSKRMSRRDPVALARRSSVRIEGRVRPLSRRATTG